MIRLIPVICLNSSLSNYVNYFPLAHIPSHSLCRMLGISLVMMSVKLMVIVSRTLTGSAPYPTSSDMPSSCFIQPICLLSLVSPKLDVSPSS